MNDNIVNIPYRHVNLEFYIDTNRINAKQNLSNMNQLEKWDNDNVISIHMPEEAFGEAIKGNDLVRSKKARRYIRSIVTKPVQQEHDNSIKEIEQILFPQGTKSQNEINDVNIVFNASYYMSILVTNDGASRRQPGGILGNRDKLTALLGYKIMTDSEAVELVKEEIRERDERVRTILRDSGLSLPDWVGKD